NAAKYFSLMGAKVIAVSEYDQKQKKIVAIYNIQGLNIPALVECKEKRGSICMFEVAKIYEDPCQLLGEKADILFLAAIENQITVYNALNIQAKYVVSAVNGGITQEGYHLLRKNRKIVGSDSIVKSGGIIASYLEKIQNSQNDKWEKKYVFEDIMARIENVLKNNVIKNQVEKHGIDMSLAGDVVAIKRIISTMEMKYLRKVKKTPKKPIIIGIFDSGLGGVIVAEKLNKMLSEGNIKLLLLTDKANFPFGQKTQDEINKITLRAIYEINERCRNIKKSNLFFDKVFDKTPYLMKCLLMKLGIVSRDVIVCFACNTVDTLVDHRRLKKRFPHIQFVGPVQNTIAKIKKLPMEAKIGVIGTAGTIKSGIYEKHIREAGYSVFVKPTPLLAVLSEMLYKKSFDTEKMQVAFYRTAREIIRANLEEFIKYNRISHICLACTHYDYLKATIKDIFGDIQFISTVETVIDEVKNLLKRLPLQLGERELEFVKMAKKGRDFDRLILEEIILSQNLAPNEKVRLGEVETHIKDTIQSKLGGIRAEEIEDINFFDSKSVKIKLHGKELVISLFPSD
ncbi:MAG: aspartate/glutamate racemase family protein, partial [Candidatus Brocadia sp.]